MRFNNSTTSRLLIFVLVLIVSLALQPKLVCSLRSIDFVLRRNAGEKQPSDVKDNTVVGFDAKKRSEATPPESSGPNRTSERRVRRGSDPIHNSVLEGGRMEGNLEGNTIEQMMQRRDGHDYDESLHYGVS